MMPKILFLCFGYMISGRLEPYRERIVQLLAAAGADVLTVKTNSFCVDYSHEPLSPPALARVVEAVRAFDPDLVISINRTGLNAEVVRTLRQGIRIVTWFQDPYYYATDELLEI